MIWQIVPCSRPDCVADVVSRFRAQTLESAKLCLVVNGWAPHVEVERFLKERDAWPDLLLRTEKSPVGKAIALNEALEQLQGELVAIRDDDDIQEPGDLEEALKAYQKKGAAAVVKLPHKVFIGDTLWMFAEDLANTWAVFEDGTPDCRISGSNMLFHTNLRIQFPLVRAVESRHWARLLTEQGERIWRTSVNNYTWVRGRSDHLWRASEAMIRYEYGMPERPPKGNEFVPARQARRLVNGSWEWVAPPTLSEMLGSV
jgi:hypothetical protein